ncbi:unnamed protein product [Linum tenue]|uniref:Transmembrane protein n=1 Tax=Linum tenue TaxID=586396 RepID=A0AAV0S0J3_9ROSI|nr:unnamed protein product [Linum tenue]
MEMEDNNAGRDFYVDLESGPNNNNTGRAGEPSSPPSPGNGVRSLFNKVYSVLAKGEEEGQKLLCGNGGGTNSDGEQQAKSEDNNETTASSGSDHSDEKQQQRRKSSSPHKKSPKPPRPPRGPSLDAADLKLIKEISELAMLKRARIERIKAMKKAKVAKQSPVSSTGNLFAMVFTVLFFLVILCQGMSSRIIPIDLQTAPEPSRMMDNDLISVQYFGVPTVNGPVSLSSGSHKYVNHCSDVNPPDSARRLG